MIVHRFVHLSDIHFGQEQNGLLVIHEDVREELLKDSARMAQRLGAASRLIVTGDVAFRGTRPEYQKASEWLERLAGTVGCTNTAVCVIPGNHDVDMGQVDHVARMVHESIRGGSPAQAQAHLEGIAKGNPDGYPLFPKLKAYREFAEGYGCDFESIAKPIWEKDIPFEEPYTLRILGLNSVQISEDKKDTRGNMILGNQQYTVQRVENVEYLVLVHHPLDWFKDRIEAKQYLYSRARVIMVGHEHLLDINKISDEKGFERMVIYSGATNPPEVAGPYTYTYNWLEIFIKEIDTAPQLVIRVCSAPLKTRQSGPRFLVHVPAR